MNPSHALKRFEDTGCDAVHIGRAAIANPFIFRQTWETMNGLSTYQPSTREMHQLIYEYLGYLREAMPEKGVIGRLKMFSAQFLKGVANAAHLRTLALRAQTVEEMLPFIDEYFELAEQYGIDMHLQTAQDAASEAMTCGV